MSPLPLVRRTYLALRAPAALRPSPEPAGRPLRLERCAPCPVARYRALYAAVGHRWHWYDRLAWSDAALAAHLARSEVSVCVLHEGDVPIGYYELERQPDGSFAVVYFGLVAEADGRPVHGRGIGGWFLTQAVGDAFAQGATVVWLHTCTLDGPHALRNYLARGFVPFRDTEYVEAAQRPAFADG